MQLLISSSLRSNSKADVDVAVAVELRVDAARSDSDSDRRGLSSMHEGRPFYIAG
jgi:hypothetical protein